MCSPNYATRGKSYRLMHIRAATQHKGQQDNCAQHVLSTVGLHVAAMANTPGTLPRGTAGQPGPGSTTGTTTTKCQWQCAKAKHTSTCTFVNQPGFQPPQQHMTGHMVRIINSHAVSNIFHNSCKERAHTRSCCYCCEQMHTAASTPAPSNSDRPRRGATTAINKSTHSGAKHTQRLAPMLGGTNQAHTEVTHAARTRQSQRKSTVQRQPSSWIIPATQPGACPGKSRQPSH